MNIENINNLKIGDRVEICFTDTGGSIVWSFNAIIDKDENGDLWFNHNSSNNSQHLLVKNINKQINMGYGGVMQGNKIVI
jgi:hypothetical protein